MEEDAVEAAHPLRIFVVRIDAEPLSSSGGHIVRPAAVSSREAQYSYRPSD